MTPAERDLITDLFSRLRSADTGARDRDAEALIAELVARHPGAAYLLAQTALVQEQALKGAAERIAELEKQAPARDAPSGGFLASAPRLGPWGDRRVEPVARADAEPARSPFSYQPRAAMAAAPGAGPQAAGGGGGSFLRTALTTAAGVAGGALLFEGVRNMLGHNAGPFGSAMAAQPGATPSAGAQPPAGAGDTADRHSPGDERDVAQDDRYDDGDDADEQDGDDGDDAGFGDFGSDDDNV